MEAAYGVNVLKYTETVPATSGASLASEVLRGLGYWYFYGTDRVGPWTQASVAYTQDLWLIAASFAVPVLAFLAAVVARWRHRAYFVLVTVVGMVLAGRALPLRPPVGRRLAAQDDHGGHHGRAGHAVHGPGLPAHPPRAGGVPRGRGPAVAPGSAGPGWSSLAFAPGRGGRGVAPLWTGPIIADGFTQPAAPPAYVRQAAAALDKTHPDLRSTPSPATTSAPTAGGTPSTPSGPAC